MCMICDGISDSDEGLLKNKEGTGTFMDMAGVFLMCGGNRRPL